MFKILQFVGQSGFALGVFTAEQQQIISMIVDDLMSLVITLAVASIGLSLPIILRTFHGKLEIMRIQQGVATMQMIAKMAVRASEQTIHPEDHTLKFDYAAKILEDYASSNRLRGITHDMIRILVESAVFDIKKNNTRHERCTA